MAGDASEAGSFASSSALRGGVPSAAFRAGLASRSGLALLSLLDRLAGSLSAGGAGGDAEERSGPSASDGSGCAAGAGAAFFMRLRVRGGLYMAASVRHGASDAPRDEEQPGRRRAAVAPLFLKGPGTDLSNSFDLFDLFDLDLARDRRQTFPRKKTPGYTFGYISTPMV